MERYLSILEVLVEEPLSFENACFASDVECNALKRDLGFLMLHKLVEERPQNDERSLFAITERGLTVFKTLRAHQYFKKLRKVLPIVDEAEVVNPLLSEGEHEREKP